MWGAAALLSAAAAVSAEEATPIEAALRFFSRDGTAVALERIASGRPGPVSALERRLVLAALPAEGEVSELDSGQRQKLAGARQILALHGREDVYVVKVILVPGAAVALHARTVLLISESALELLSREEVQALAAHEAGHEYFWDEYAEARRTGHYGRLRTVELLCDGVAIVTLRRAGIDPRRLTSALEKVVRYNHARFGTALNEAHYPSIHDRRVFARQLLDSLGSAAGLGR